MGNAAICAKSSVNSYTSGAAQIENLISTEGALHVVDPRVAPLAFDAWGTPISMQPQSLFHSLFTYDVPSRLWLKYHNGVEVPTTTKIISNNGHLEVTADVVIQKTTIGSKRHPRYQPNRGHRYSASHWFNNPTATGTRDFGLFTEENGVFFRLKDGLLYAVLRRGGVEYPEQINLPFAVDFSKGNIYDIQFQWRGVGNYKFFIGNPATGRSELVHVIEHLGTRAGLSVYNPAMPVRMECVYINTPLTIYCGCVDVTSEGGLPSEKGMYASTISDPKTCTTNTPIIAIRQPNTILGQHNTRDCRLLRITISSDKKGVADFYMTRDDTALVGGDWTTVNGGIGSYIEENKTATSLTLAKAHKVLPIDVQANITREVTNPDPQIVDFTFVHGDILIIVGTGASASMTAIFEWGEEV